MPNGAGGAPEAGPGLVERERERDYTYPALRLIQVPAAFGILLFIHVILVGCVYVSPGPSVLAPRLACRVKFAVRADARDVPSTCVYIYIYNIHTHTYSGSGLLLLLQTGTWPSDGE